MGRSTLSSVQVPQQLGSTEQGEVRVEAAAWKSCSLQHVEKENSMRSCPPGPEAWQRTHKGAVKEWKTKRSATRNAGILHTAKPV